MMGYSLSVQATSQEQAEEIHSMAKELLDALLEYPYHLTTGDVSYAPSKANKELLVGIDAITTNETMFGVMAFLSIKFNLQDDQENNVFFYDHQKMIVKNKLYRERFKKLENVFFVNNDGSPHYASFHPNIDAQRQAISASISKVLHSKELSLDHHERKAHKI